MEMSFKEKSAWISLACTLAVLGYYLSGLLGLGPGNDEDTKRAAMTLLTKAVILTIIIEAVFHGMLAATNHRAAEMGADERDRLIELRANNLGYNVLGFGVVAVILRMLILEFNPSFTEHESAVAIPMLTVHLLMFSFIASEIVRFGGQIFFYRRGY